MTSQSVPFTTLISLLILQCAVKSLSTLVIRMHTIQRSAQSFQILICFADVALLFGILLRQTLEFLTMSLVLTSHFTISAFQAVHIVGEFRVAVSHTT